MSRIRHVALAAVILAGGCAPSSAAQQTEPIFTSASEAVLAAHRLQAVGPTTTMSTLIGDPAEHPWLLYREVSQAIGLDFTSLVGRTAELQKTPITTASGPATAFVLIHDGRVVGAWRDAGPMSSGVLALNE